VAAEAIMVFVAEVILHLFVQKMKSPQSNSNANLINLNMR